MYVHIYLGCYIHVYTCLNETKKGGETSKSNLKGGIGSPTCIKSIYRRQDRDPGWFGDIRTG